MTSPASLRMPGPLSFRSMGVPPMSIRGILPLHFHGQDARATASRRHYEQGPAWFPPSSGLRTRFSCLPAFFLLTSTTIRSTLVRS